MINVKDMFTAGEQMVQVSSISERLEVYRQSFVLRDCPDEFVIARLVRPIQLWRDRVHVETQRYLQVRFGR